MGGEEITVWIRGENVGREEKCPAAANAESLLANGGAAEAAPFQNWRVEWFI
jgi:hypothetical protein